MSVRARISRFTPSSIRTAHLFDTSHGTLCRRRSAQPWPKENGSSIRSTGSSNSTPAKWRCWRRRPCSACGGSGNSDSPTWRFRRPSIRASRTPWARSRSVRARSKRSAPTRPKPSHPNATTPISGACCARACCSTTSATGRSATPANRCSASGTSSARSASSRGRRSPSRWRRSASMRPKCWR